MERTVVTPAAPSDAAAVTEVVAALESALYGRVTISQADLEDEWSDIDIARDVRLVRDGDRIVGYALLRARPEIWRAEAYVHPDVVGRGVGTLIASELERDAARGGARALHNAVLEADRAAGRLLESLGYHAVRVFREMRIELDGPPLVPEWPAGLRVVAFDRERDAAAFHAAHQEAFADHWDHQPRDLASWSRAHLDKERFDPALWCVIWAGDEIAAGTICTGATYGGGWVDALFTRRAWRRRGVGAVLLQDAFARLWARGEHSVGLGVDTANPTGAFALYERAGMKPVLGWVVYEKQLDDEHSA
jgi:mycothiol synthase